MGLPAMSLLAVGLPAMGLSVMDLSVMVAPDTGSSYLGEKGCLSKMDVLMERLVSMGRLVPPGSFRPGHPRFEGQPCRKPLASGPDFDIGFRHPIIQRCFLTASCND